MDEQIARICRTSKKACIGDGGTPMLIMSSHDSQRILDKRTKMISKAKKSNRFYRILSDDYHAWIVNHWYVLVFDMCTS